jgi:hypothetical protein
LTFASPTADITLAQICNGASGACTGEGTLASSFSIATEEMLTVGTEFYSLALTLGVNTGGSDSPANSQNGFIDPRAALCEPPDRRAAHWRMHRRPGAWPLR